MKLFNRIKTFLGSRKKISISVVVLVLIISISFTASRNTDNNFETVKNLDIFYSLYKEVNLYYVDPIVPGDIIKTGIDAMLNSLDPYTVYIPESQTEDLKIMTTGKYGGIGALIRKKDDYTMVTQPYENSPAAKSGVIAGDIILEIDGRTMKDKASEDVSELLRGEPKTKVKLKLKRIGEEKPIEISIEREEIKMNSVPYYGMLEDNIGYIYLNSFTNTAGKEVKDAFTDLKKNNDLNTIVLDLRGNSGGLLIEAVKICNLFVEKGSDIVSMKGKVAQMDKVYNAESNPMDTDIKVIVLVNRGSASASEIVAGCIQDLDRGVIIGQRTYGKGLVQTTRELSYNGILKVTTAKYYTPSGRCIQALDYTHRNEDGSVGNIPDSLISEFKTKNGRTVYDGGGVEPDITVEEKKISNITVALVINDLIFDYANHYKYTHPTIESAGTFKFTDKDYDDFLNFIKNKDFDYKSKTEEALNKLIEESKEEKYYDTAEAELKGLSEKFKRDREKDLMLFKDEIIDIISTEILSKYYYDKGVIIYSLKNDDEVRKAVEIAKNNDSYLKTLNPSKK
ncbi:MAG: S41 family peptidase [Bacteroidales bacterium]|jgi:carboxyl-terminal processing protease|nr:S41 family peptidase [Bacteroidales bacterium]